MPKRSALRSRDDLQPDDLLRLADACEIIFQGQLTPASLRREAARGKLAITRIAGKDFVTPADIDRMRELCTVRPASQKPSPVTPESSGPDREAGRRSQEVLRQMLAERRAAYGKK